MAQGPIAELEGWEQSTKVRLSDKRAPPVPDGASNELLHATELVPDVPKAKQPAGTDMAVQAPREPAAPDASIGGLQGAPGTLGSPGFTALARDLQSNILTPNGFGRAHHWFLSVQRNRRGILEAKYLVGMLASTIERRVSVRELISDPNALAAMSPDLRELAEAWRDGPANIGAELHNLLKELQVSSEHDAYWRRALNRSKKDYARGVDKDRAAPVPFGALGTHEFSVNVLLTQRGYECLDLEPPADAAFRAGMLARSALLNDPDPRKTARHIPTDVDVLLIVAYDADDGDPEPAAVTALRTIVKEHATLHEEIGHVLRLQPRNPESYPIEPFGYRDNISQVAFYQSDRERALRPHTSVEHWDPAAPLSVALCPDPHGRSPYACGSYFVFRKLEQDIPAFYSKSSAEAVSKLDPEQFRERLVGRKLDGTPLDRDAKGLEDFDFRTDQRGEHCPFFAHIRKNNPRSDLWPNRRQPPLAAQSRRISRPEDDRRVVRRGIPYGPAIVRDARGVPVLDEKNRVQFVSEKPGPLGLLFLCAQGDIERQFEHLQICWANKHDHPRGKFSAVDPISGQLQPGVPNRLPLGGNQGDAIAPFVTFRGGEYFFAPSISFLRGQLDDLLDPNWKG